MSNPNATFMYCDICGNAFDTWEGLNNHRFTQHGNPVPTFHGPGFPCSKCAALERELEQSKDQHKRAVLALCELRDRFVPNNSALSYIIEADEILNEHHPVLGRYTCGEPIYVLGVGYCGYGRIG